jgi:hypothetical protein
VTRGKSLKSPPLLNRPAVPVLVLHVWIVELALRRKKPSRGLPVCLAIAAGRAITE